MQSPRAVSTALLALTLSFVAVILLRTAWLSDVAYLTLRTVEHAASGLGARWNVVERVQVYDHPLWFLTLLTGRLLTGETYFSALGLSILCSLLAAWILVRRASNDIVVVLTAGALALSPLFMTFSTSGLETPLVHLLVVAIAVRACESDRPGRHRAIALMTGLAILTRWTTVWIALPAWIAVARRSRRRDLIIEVALILAPLMIWSAWAWRYYGVLTPVSWVADAALGLSWRDRLSLGGTFFSETLHVDPLLVTAIAIGIVVGVWARGVDAWLAAGAALALLWTIARGGSVMAGRDLTAPFLIAMLVIVRRLNTARGAVAVSAALAVMLAGVVVMTPTFRSDSRFAADWLGTARVHDPRLEDYQATALLLANRPEPAPRHSEAARGRQAAADRQGAALSPAPGMFGIAAGPSVYVADAHGTVDPLVARLPPAVGSRRQWLANRRMPDGYLESVVSDRSTLRESPLAMLDDELRLASRAPLGASGRLTLWQRLPSDAAELISQSSYGPTPVALGDLSNAHDAPRTLREGGLLIALPQRRAIGHIEADLSANYDYQISIWDGDSLATRLTVRGSVTAPPHLTLRSFSSGRSAPVTAISIRCGRGVGPCLVGAVRIVD